MAAAATVTDGLDVSNLSPSDAVAALRSFPRRFSAVLALVDEDDDSVLHRPGPDGLSAQEHADAAARDLAAAGEAIRRALGREGAPAGGDTAESLADLVGHVSPGDWGPGLDLLRGAVKTTAEHLHGAERARRQR